MGERKVLNKYIPADFDPKLVPRGKKPKDDLIPVRMMLPFSIQCSTCSSFLYRGRKFNSKKEPVKGIDGKYLGIQRFRFYIKCSDCSRPITFCKFYTSIILWDCCMLDFIASISYTNHALVLFVPSYSDGSKECRL